MLNLHMNLSKVVAAPGNSLYQEFFQVYSFTDKLLDSGKRCINRAVACSCCSMDLSVDPHADSSNGNRSLATGNLQQFKLH